MVDVMLREKASGISHICVSVPACRAWIHGIELSWASPISPATDDDIKRHSGWLVMKWRDVLK